MVTSSESVEGDGSSVPFSKSYTKTFYEVFPFYLSIGMTPEQYWDGDPMLAHYYRKAEEMRQKRKNEETGAIDWIERTIDNTLPRKPVAGATEG